LNGTDIPYKSQPKAKARDEGHVHHHLSPWALFVALSAPIFAIGVITTPWILIVGGLLLAASITGWIYEDYKEFPKGPNPLTQPTQGEKGNGWWGVVAFLATEVILFGSIFGVWFAARALSPVGWPPIGTPDLPVVFTAVNTLILISSGVVMHWGEVGLKKGNRKRFLMGFGGAIILGTVFLAGQVYEYIELIEHGFLLGTNIYTTTFYMLTGTHGIHVAGGLIFLTIVFVRGALGQFDATRHEAVQAAAYYWHFVDIVWIFLFVVVYLEPFWAG
jgi:cytochrome c oxidase subunit III